jgi:hypothetical protein
MSKRTDYMDEIEVLIPYMRDGKTKTWEWTKRFVNDSHKNLPKDMRRCAGEGCNHTHDIKICKASPVQKAHAKHMHTEEAIICNRSPKGK